MILCLITYLSVYFETTFSQAIFPNNIAAKIVLSLFFNKYKEFSKIPRHLYSLTISDTIQPNDEVSCLDYVRVASTTRDS